MEAMCTLGNADHGPDWTEDGMRNASPICDGLEVVIVFLMIVEDLAIAHLIDRQTGYVQKLDTGETEEGEVLGDKGDSVGT